MSTGCSARISYRQNAGEFLQSESTSESIANEEDSVECFLWIQATTTRCPWRVFQNAQPLIVPERICAYARCFREPSDPQIAFFDDGNHGISINPGMHSRDKRRCLPSKTGRWSHPKCSASTSNRSAFTPSTQTAGRIRLSGTFGERSPGIRERQVSPLDALKKLTPDDLRAEGMHLSLERQGHEIGVKRIYRLCAEEGLLVPLAVDVASTRTRRFSPSGHSPAVQELCVVAAFSIEGPNTLGNE